MPGGDYEVYESIKYILTKISAQVDSGPCVTYIGKGGAGNYVKMVHNGIEYGDMELIAEAYDILKTIGKLTNEELHEVFENWNKSELQSFLIEITSKIFLKKDENDESKYLLDQVVDERYEFIFIIFSGNKGTGFYIKINIK
jgi:6-phosphogluconate dehydrogenase